MSKILMEHGSLPLSSLRLIVPPLQLVSAALWEIVRQGAVMYYGLLDEFVTSVLETVPGLLSYAERVQLVTGLRARVVLELCRSDDFSSPQVIQLHLSRINTYIAKQDKEISSTEVKASVTNFLKLIHTLVDDQCQRDIFYQKIFPTVFGPKYDSALEALMRKFLFNLQKLLPVPNLEQTSLWLSLSPSVLKECVDFMNKPEPLNTLMQHHKHHVHEVPQALSSPGDDCILSSLSYHLPKVDNDDGDKVVKPGSALVSEDWQRDGSLGSKSKKDKEQNIEGMDPEVASDAERNGQRRADDLTEDQGASVEVILEPFDESESDDDVGAAAAKKWFHHLKTHNRTSSEDFKCPVCGQDFGSMSQLKRHRVTQSGCGMNRPGRSDPASQSRFFEKINLHPKPKINAGGRENELPLASTQNLSGLSGVPESDDNSLVCQACGKVFTYPKNFDKHQRACAVGNKRQAQTNPSTSPAHRPEPNGADDAKAPAEPSDAAPQGSAPSGSCKRSSRVKKCSACGKVFTRSADLTRHMRCHAEPSPYLCSRCGKDFDGCEEFEAHKGGRCGAPNPRPQAQGELARQDPSGSARKRKEEGAPAPASGAPADAQARKSPLTCQECGQSFSYCRSFEKHRSKCSKRSPRRKKRTNTSHFIIDACDFGAAGGESDSEAKEGRAERRPNPAGRSGDSQAKSCAIKCTVCDKSFSEIVLLKRHYSKSHKIRGSYPCPLCKRSFVRLCELVRHQQNKKLYQCAACQKCYTKPGLLSDHGRVHAASAPPRVCDTCGKSFKSLAYLVLHQSKHRERQPSVCPCCGKQFSTKDCLRAHMVRHTGGYPCPACGKRFYQKTYLKWHLYKHTGQEPYLCDACGKGWPSAAQLKLHMVQHTEARPFKCDECGACYKRGSHLTAHRRDKHIRLRPFACDVCGKAFRLNNELRKHAMVHTGERPFACPKCGKAFTRKTRLREHREKTCL